MAKEGYEAAPLLGGAPAAPSQAAQPQEAPPRKWHGHLLNPFGACDALGWTTCLVTHYMPCVTFGLTNRKAFAKSALRSGLIFATLVAITYCHYAVQLSLVSHECLADLPPLDDFSAAPRRMGPAFGREDGASAMTHVGLRCAKPFGRHIDAARLHSASASSSPVAGGPDGLCMRLVHTSVALNLATLVYTLLLVVYGASLRTQMRQRFGIEGSSFKDFLAWWCCMPCAMCQEARTMAVNNVEGGVWHGPADGLPVYAAAETEAPSVPVMSAAAMVKPLKA